MASDPKLASRSRASVPLAFPDLCSSTENSDGSRLPEPNRVERTTDSGSKGRGEAPKRVQNTGDDWSEAVAKFGGKRVCINYATGFCKKGGDCKHSHDCAAICAFERQWLTSDGFPKVSLSEIGLDKKRCAKTTQKWDFCAVLYLKQRSEISEFPVVVIDLSLKREVARFHRFIHSANLRERIEEMKALAKVRKVEIGSYVNASMTAVPFTVALFELSQLLVHLGVALEPVKEKGHSLLFATFGNCALKAQMPKMCRMAGVSVPKVMQSWLNVNDFVLNNYAAANAKKCRDVHSMTQLLALPSARNCFWMDQCTAIARVVLRCVADGCQLQATGWREADESAKGRVRYLYKKRVDQRALTRRTDFHRHRPRHRWVPPRRRPK